MSFFINEPIHCMNLRFHYQLFVVISLISLSLLWGCKDTELTDDASLLEQCKLHLDDGEWSDAIDVCTDAGGDDGYHYAAQAYMGQGGLSLLNLIRTMTGSSDSSAAASAIFSFVPETDEEKVSFRKALEFLMGSKISNKSQTVYLEGLLVSSILVFAELKSVFGIAESAGSFTTCDIDVTDDSDPDKCSFTVDVSADSPPLLTFSGLGNTIYTNLCCNLDDATCSAVSSANDTTPLNDPSADYDVTINHCAIETRSVLQLNKNAYDNFQVTEAFKNDVGTNVLSPLDFYTMFDSGNRYNVSGDEVPLCKASFFPDVTSDNAEVYDCEIIGAVFDPGSELF